MRELQDLRRIAQRGARNTVWIATRDGRVEDRHPVCPGRGTEHQTGSKSVVYNVSGLGYTVE